MIKSIKNKQIPFIYFKPFFHFVTVMSIKSIVKYAFLIATVYYSVRLSVCLYTFLKNIFDVSSRTTVSNVKSESFFNLEMKNTNCTIRMCVLKKPFKKSSPPESPDQKGNFLQQSLYM